MKKIKNKKTEIMFNIKLLAIMLLGMFTVVVLPIVGSFFGNSSLISFAETYTELCSGIEIESNATAVTDEVNAKITFQVKGKDGSCGGDGTATTENITIRNVSGSAATISFDWTATSVNQLMIDGTEYTETSGSFKSNVIAAGGSFTITITTGKNSTVNKLDMSNFAVVAAKDSSTVNFEFDSALGSVTVAGTAITSGSRQDISGETGAALVATAKNGGSFLGWVDADGKILSTAASYTLKPATDMTVKAVYVNTTSDKAWFMVGQYLTNDLNKAGELGNSIVLMNNGTLAQGNYTIESGDTLLIPFDDANTLCTTKPEIKTWSSGTPASNGLAPKAYRTLTMASGANITVKGALSVSGTQGASMPYNGWPVGELGYINMEQDSNITIDNGAFLYAWGYIMGKGSVVAESGATVYECFQLTDYRGGNCTNEMKSNSQRVFPLNQYYIQNIEVPLTLKAGANEKVFFAVDVSYAGIQDSTIDLVSSEGKNAMFNVNSGYIIKDYDEATDRIIFDVCGTVTMRDFSVDIKVVIIGSISLKSSSFDMPITNNMTINIKDYQNNGETYGSVVNLNQDLSLLPGAVINIEENSTVKIGSGNRLVVYDIDQWDTYCGSSNKKMIPLTYAPGRTCSARTVESLTDASIKVNGTLDASQGYIYTTAGGANIYSIEAGKIIIQKPLETAKVYQVKQTGNTINDDGWIEIPITPAQLKNANGEYVATGTYLAIKSPLEFNYTKDEGIWYNYKITYTNVDTNKDEYKYLCHGDSLELGGVCSNVPNGGTASGVATYKYHAETKSCIVDANAASNNLQCKDCGAVFAVVENGTDFVFTGGYITNSYYSIIEIGNKKYLINEIVPNNNNECTFTVSSGAFAEWANQVFNFTEDPFAGQDIRLRGYQIGENGNIRFFAVIGKNFNSDNVHNQYKRIDITMSIGEDNGVVHQYYVYDYLYGSGTGESYNFVDSAVFSVRTNLNHEDFIDKTVTLTIKYDLLNIGDTDVIGASASYKVTVKVGTDGTLTVGSIALA